MIYCYASLHLSIYEVHLMERIHLHRHRETLIVHLLEDGSLRFSFEGVT